jgi:hypothetical protein
MHSCLTCACLPTFKPTASTKFLTRQANDLRDVVLFFLNSEFFNIFLTGKRAGWEGQIGLFQT